MRKVLERHEVPAEVKWKLEDIYASDELFERDLAAARAGLAGVQELRGSITSSQNLLKVLKRRDELGMLVDRLTAYAFMRRDEDNGNSKYQAYADQALSVDVMARSAFAFLEPEILSLESTTVWEWVEAEPELAVYKHYLHNVLRMQAHTLPAEQEQLLAEAGEIAAAPGNIFGMFNDADLKFPEITDEQGEKVELTHGRYIQFLESRDRRVREEAFTALYTTYEKWKNTLGAMYTSELKKARFFAKARRYDSALEAALDQDNVPTEVYRNLIQTIHDHLGLLHKYVDLRKRLLGVDELHMYDIYVPLVGEEQQPIAREQAVAMVQEGLKALGATYLKDLEQAFTDGWIDWLENRGKTSGAYSWEPTAFTVCSDELSRKPDNMLPCPRAGHAMHALHRYDPALCKLSHHDFVAEVASTVNETLVMRHLLEQTDDETAHVSAQSFPGAVSGHCVPPDHVCELS